MIEWKEQLEVNILTRNEASKLIGDSKEYYVYILWKMYVDYPIPFYVGKGHKQRLIKHEMKSEESNNIYKSRIIKKHKKLDIETGYSIFNFFENEYDALAIEKELIQLIGRFDLGNGPLTNRTDGGDGTLGHLAPKGKDSHSARVVIANNTLYGCLKDASENFNITPSALMSRIRNGWPGYYYEDEGQRHKSKKILGRYRKQVVVEGNEFVSASEASRKLELDVGMICKRINYGWDGYYYVEQGQLPRKTIWGSRTDKVPVIVRGVTYSTIAEAVKETGESTAIVSKRCLSSNFQEYSRADGKIIEKESPPRFPEEVIIESMPFKSLGEAAEFHNLSDGGVAYRCRSENYPDWYFKNEEKQKKESFSPEFSSTPISVTIDGIIFSSQSAAALANNIDINTLKKRCRSYSFPSWHCEGVKKVESKDGKAGLIGIRIEGKEYRSISMASKELGIARHAIKTRLNSNDWSDYEKL